ncbi:MAG: SHOCT domain-containing protein [Betaproteobacteria bacterium]|nr:SHOCT domain-containing protein [Betaproteobacteria bacterium]
MMWTYGLWGGFPWMWVFPLFFFVVMLFFIFFRGGLPMCGGHDARERKESAREILDRRYARGEIGQEEYQQIKKEMEK